MTTRPPEPTRPVSPARTSRPPRNRYFTGGWPRTRAAIWAAALLSGGLGLILIFFWAIGVIDLYEFPYLGAIALGLSLFFALTIWTFSRSEKRANSRWADRERRGF
jgi:fatty acid desaturase